MMTPFMYIIINKHITLNLTNIYINVGKVTNLSIMSVIVGSNYKKK